MHKGFCNGRAAIPDAGVHLPRPGWVAWIAQDSSGVWWGYSAEPLRNDSGWYENEVGQCARLGHTQPSGWEQSLQPVC